MLSMLISEGLRSFFCFLRALPLENYLLPLSFKLVFLRLISYEKSVPRPLALPIRPIPSIDMAKYLIYL